jgi:hypothetical protein
MSLNTHDSVCKKTCALTIYTIHDGVVKCRKIEQRMNSCPQDHLLTREKLEIMRRKGDLQSDPIYPVTSPRFEWEKVRVSRLRNDGRIGLGAKWSYILVVTRPKVLRLNAEDPSKS